MSTCRESIAGEDSDDEQDPFSFKKSVPPWAQKDRWMETVKAQQAIDGDIIFGEQKATCNLVALFGVPHTDKARERFRNRRETGDWSKDHLKETDKAAYRIARGYAAV